MRKTVKVLHTVAAGGLVGGLVAYMLLLLSPPETPAAYADLRANIAIVANYLLLPSLALALVSGLLSMMVHKPFMEKGWVWLKAGLGILMFKGVLTIVSAKADHAATVARRIAAGEADPGALDRLVALEWWTLVVVLAITVANYVLGVWRPNSLRPSPRRRRPPAAPEPAPTPIPGYARRPARPLPPSLSPDAPLAVQDAASVPLPEPAPRRELEPALADPDQR
jgi:uncharacterized membrane protein